MNEVSTNNVGQVTGIFIGNYEPTNKNLIWYDNTPNQMCHKVYDYKTKSWVALNPVIVAPTTYSEIVNSAKKNGLPIGKHYQITDKSNVLAVSISKTKIWYVDNLGNILVDDLGSNIQYHVSSSNLLIDDINGVFDITKNKLIFKFNDSAPDYDNDYVLGKKKSGTSWILSKFKLSSFLSKNSDNDISWNGGFFFNFKAAISGILNKVGGVVGYDIYDKEVSKLNTVIRNVSQENQNIIKNVNQSIKNETTADKIYGKAIPKKIDTSVELSDVRINDTLFNILSKFQCWINRFKYADGILLPKSFAGAENKQYINNNDTVNSAFQKIQYFLKNPTIAATLSDGWKEYDYKGDMSFPEAGDSIDSVVAKIIAKIRQLGDISYSRLIDNYTKGKYTNFDIGNGSLSLKEKVYLNEEGIAFKSDNKNDSDGGEFYGFEVTEDKFRYKADTAVIIKNNMLSSALIESKSDISRDICAFQSVVSDYGDGGGYNVFDAFFSRFKCGSITFNTELIKSTDYAVTNRASFIVWGGSENGYIRLPHSPSDGLMILIYYRSFTNSTLHILTQGSDLIENTNGSFNSITISELGSVFAFIYFNTLWKCVRWDGPNLSA